MQKPAALAYRATRATLAVLATLALVPVLAHAQPATTTATTQALIPAQSSVGFAIQQMGVPVQGQFKKFEAQLNFDPAKLAASRMAFTVDVGSATMGSREVDAEMPKPVWFNAVKFSQASFQSSAIQSVGAGKLEVAGKLSIKGAVRDVVVPVTLSQSGSGVRLTTVASRSFAIPRLAFQVGEAEWADTAMVADQVQVTFKLALSGAPPLK